MQAFGISTRPACGASALFIRMSRALGWYARGGSRAGSPLGCATFGASTLSIGHISKKMTNDRKGTDKWQQI